MSEGEAKVYQYRTRAYHPGLGRFMQVDRIGVWGDGGNDGNGFGYAGSGPLRAIDPYGLSFIEDAGDGIREIWEGFPNIFYSPPEEPVKPAAPNLVRPAPCPKGENVDDIYDLVRGPRDPADWQNPNSNPGDQKVLDEWESGWADYFDRQFTELLSGAEDLAFEAAMFAPPGRLAGILGKLTARGWTVVKTWGKSVVTITKGGKVATLAEDAAAGAAGAVRRLNQSIEGRGPASLRESLAMEEAMAGAGERIMHGMPMGDPRYAGWFKMQHVHEYSDGTKTVIHYVRDPRTGKTAQFKFK